MKKKQINHHNKRETGHTLTSQWVQTLACSFSDPLGSSYKTLSPPAYLGMDCYLQYGHIVCTQQFSKVAIFEYEI